jgi:hypothetical protein
MLERRCRRRGRYRAQDEPRADAGREEGSQEVQEQLIDALTALRTALASATLAVPTPERAADRALRDRLIAEVDSHVARIRDLEAPLLAVLGGGTGAGKSTVANSLIGQSAAATGVVRPTTSSPTLLHAPADSEWFAGDRILPGYARSHPSGRDSVGRQTGRVLHLVSSHAVPPGLAVLDAPDVDSVRDENRRLADELLDAADVWVWFVTARTYADEEGMRYLRRASRRRTALAVVLNQVHDRDADEIVDDLRGKLEAEGLREVEVLIIPLTATQSGRLPDRAVSDLRRWLRGLADPEARDRLRYQTLDGALDDLATGTEPLVDAMRAELAVITRLDRAAADAWEAMPVRFATALDEGPPLRQEVIARWSTFVGTSRFLTLVESATESVKGWVRDAMSSVTSAEQDRLQRQVKIEVADTLADLIVRVADLAATDAAALWETTTVGRTLLAEDPSLRRSAPDLRGRAEEAVVAWQAAVTELIATKGAVRKTRAKWVTTVVNGAATAVILATFASTGGITGIEAGVAGGAAAANQALLVKLLGDSNVAWILREARKDLIGRVTELAGEERRRCSAALEPLTPARGTVTEIDRALRAVAVARR